MRASSLALAFLLCLGACATEPRPVPGRTAYVNGFVFNGEHFQPGAIVVEGASIVSAAPETATERIDLAGGYVVPPFCEAHNHNLGSPYENEASINAYLRQGIFYVGLLSNVPTITDQVRDTYNIPTSVDVLFGNGGLTATGGHPIRLREFLLEQGNYPGFTRETLADETYFVIDNEADLERRWPIIMGFEPDFIKIFLLFSEEFDRRRDDEAFFGLKGLDPELVPRIVERAHADGLRVFAHVESGHDFHVALASGVDVIAHLPGNSQPTRIDPADARLAAERGVPVMTTAMLIERPNRRRDPARYEAMRRDQIANLRALRDAGVTLAAGSDEFTETSAAEIAHLRGLGVFTNAELLRMWSTDCSRTLFPQRRLGELAPGYEASFLVLGANPLDDFAATADIRMRVKQGVVLNIAPTPPA
jgi:imidazolonepropionase-like amidohydrolase